VAALGKMPRGIINDPGDMSGKAKKFWTPTRQTTMMSLVDIEKLTLLASGNELATAEMAAAFAEDSVLDPHYGLAQGGPTDDSRDASDKKEKGKKDKKDKKEKDDGKDRSNNADKSKKKLSPEDRALL
jgi:hypothetical protein